MRARLGAGYEHGFRQNGHFGSAAESVSQLPMPAGVLAKTLSFVITEG